MEGKGGSRSGGSPGEKEMVERLEVVEILHQDDNAEVRLGHVEAHWLHDLLGLLQTLVLDPVQLFLHQRVLPDLLLLLLELALFVSPLVLQPRRWAAAWVA